MRISNRIRLLGGVLLLGALVQVGVAAPAGPKNGDEATLPAYERLDANRDGIVTLPEVEVYGPRLAERIRHCDADNDGKLTRGEYASCKPKGGAAKAK